MGGCDRDDNIGLAPADQRLRAHCERDVRSRLTEQAQFVCEGRDEALDREHPAAEIESSGRTQFTVPESGRRVLPHMLKRHPEPEQRSRTRAFSMAARRAEHRKDRIEAAREAGSDKRQFANCCPDTCDHIVSRELRP